MRLNPNRAGDAWVGSRLRNDEQGIALILVLVVIVILALILSTVIFYSASGARDAKRTNAGQRAYSIAEAGLNNALAQLASHYPNPDYAGDNTWVSGPTATYNGGTIAWTGTFSGSTWNLTGTGTVKNPTGGANIVRKVSASLPVSIVPAPLGLYGIYSDDAYAPCTDITGGVTVNVPIFSRNCLTMSGGLPSSGGCFISAQDHNTYCADAKVWDPPPWSGPGFSLSGSPLTGTGGTSLHTVTINVMNQLSLSGTGTTVGFFSGATNDHRAKSVSTGSCSGCSGAVFALTQNNSPRSSGFLDVLNADTKYSSPDWSTASCSGQNPWDDPSKPLNVGRNNKGGSLFQSTAYNCTLGSNSISYDPNHNGCGTITLTGIGCLEIHGSWFIDNNVDIPNNTSYYYTGSGTIYVNGEISFGNGSRVCATQDCQSWDPLRDNTQPNLLLVALNATSPVSPSFKMTGGVYEGNAWAVGDGRADACSGAIPCGSPPPTTSCSAGNAAFSSSGGAYIGGSVWTQKGCASLGGGGVLHSATALPANAPTASQYDIVGRITNYKGG